MRRLVYVAVVLSCASAVPLGCNFDDRSPNYSCEWKWDPNVWQLASSNERYNSTPSRNTKHQGYFLVANDMKAKAQIWSPKYSGTKELCQLELQSNMFNLEGGDLNIIVQTVGPRNTSWDIGGRKGISSKEWEYNIFKIGKIKQEFHIIIEAIPGKETSNYVAIDNIHLLECFPDEPEEGCMSSRFHCTNSSVCIDYHQVCDYSVDCPDGSDELQNCDKVNIEGSRCNYEQGMCGWHNELDNWMNWTLHAGPTGTANTGPIVDHTYKNKTGKYIYVEMSGPSGLGAGSILTSPLFNPPPPTVFNMSSRHYNACYVSFYYHQYGPHSGSITIMLKEQYKGHMKELWRSYGSQGNVWKRVIKRIPPISQRYNLYFEAKKSFSPKGDVAIDDFAMSPHCFGIGDFTPEELNGYSYKTAGSSYDPVGSGILHPAFRNTTFYTFTTCGVNGTAGPTHEDCIAEYSNMNVNVTVLTNKTFMGIQRWTVPKDGFYTIIAMGAGGGMGATGLGTSKGAESRLIVELQINKDIYILVGQQGTSSRKKAMMPRLATPPVSGPHPKPRLEQVKALWKDPPSATVRRSNEPIIHNTTKTGHKSSLPGQLMDKLNIIRNITALGGGGGGGGASYVFYMTTNRERVPLLVGAGGGGLAHGPSVDDGSQHGNEQDKNSRNQTGDAYGESPAGAGGGWFAGNYTYRDTTGLALVQGGAGGYGCMITFLGHGGFGGGGGGCTAGGGGGGFSGGRAWSDKSRNGEGGYSYLSLYGQLGHIIRGVNIGDGRIFIIPAVEGCGCEYRCVALDAYRSATQCICPAGWVLGSNGTSCTLPAGSERPDLIPISTTTLFGFIVGLVFVVGLISCAGCFVLYNNYQHSNSNRFRNKGADLQLQHLWQSEMNPNYVFTGSMWEANELPQIDRQLLTIKEPLGQGAFGEVCSGVLKKSKGDTVGLQCAVKKLPQYSTNFMENDFLMEAMIMSKFKHPNIVHFIGICFETHPRLIVIELLAGGDLKRFLREKRPKPDKPTNITMKDLLQCAIDVAKGCEHMELQHFIHRDIAARNCLLTTDGPGRVVKVADFGMARDIYSADYYKKGGKTMMPIKWMPPEACYDGIFSSKADVWSFGVLLWEVMSLGIMPYSGYTNSQTIHLIKSGSRLERPVNCPESVYAIMRQCWDNEADKRPNFTTILGKLQTCIEDPKILSMTLKVLFGLPTTEEETIPTNQLKAEEEEEQQQISTGYMMPISRTNGLDHSNNNKPLSCSNEFDVTKGPFIVSSKAMDQQC